MADEQSPIVTDEPNIDDVSLMDTDIAPKTDEQPVETAVEGEDKPADDQAKPTEENATKDAEGATAKDSEPVLEKKPEASPTDVAAATKDEQQRRAAMEYQNRQRTRQQIANELDQTYGPKTEEQFIDEGIEPEQAQFQAFKAELEYKEARTQIAELNAGMTAEAVNVTNDFGVYNPNSKDFDEGFTKEVEQAYRIASRLQTTVVGKNPDGSDREVVTNAEVPLYDFYQRMAGIYSRGASKGTEQGQAAMQHMMSRTEDPGGSSSTSKGDSLADLEERLGDIVIT